MSSPAVIKAALERNVKVVAARPSVGQGTAVTTVTLQPGLACEVEEGPWRFNVGMTEKYGGQNAALAYFVTVETDASDADVQRLLDTADRHSSWLDDIRNPVPVSREVRIIRREQA